MVNFISYFFFVTDVEECLSGTHPCRGIAKCINTVGSYQCICPPGYEEDANNCKGKYLYTYLGKDI